MERAVTQGSIRIRPLEARDADALVEIQMESRESAQWPRESYEALAREEAPCFVAETGGRVVGFLSARKLADEMEILNLAVASAARRQGIGSQLLREAMRWGARNGISKAYLEVRASNAAARQFYAVHGFWATGVRAKYYRDPVDDAVLLTAAATSE